MPQPKFLSTEHYLAHLTDDERVLAEKIRGTFFAVSPKIVEKISFNTLFFHYKGLFCYINKTKKGLDLCFIDGILLADAENMRKENRKNVRSILIATNDFFDAEKISNTIIEAMIIRDLKKQAKKDG